MVQTSTIPASALADIPKTRIQNDERQNEYSALVRSLSAENAMKLTPDTGETCRSISLRLHRASLRCKIGISTRIFDGSVFVALTGQTGATVVPISAEREAKKAERAAKKAAKTVAATYAETPAA